MSTTKIQNILKKVNTQVQELLDVDRFYVVLYDEAATQLEFPLVKNRNEKGSSSWATRDFGGDTVLPDRVIALQEKLVFGHNLKQELSEAGINYWPQAEKLPLAWLGMPMLGIEKQPIGAFIVENFHNADVFDAEASETLAIIASGIARVIENAWLDDRLKRKVASLKAINEVSQDLALGIQRDEQEILELICQKAGSVMDTANMFIALFNAKQKQLSFPLVVAEKHRIEDKIPTRVVDLNDEVQGGLTEIVLRRQKYLLIDNVPVWCQEQQITLPHDNAKPISWMGIPIMQKDNVLGIIALWNSKRENMYGPDDLQTLQVMSSQAAIAINNARLYRNIDQLYHETNKQLGALIEVGSNIRLRPYEILELIYEQSRMLMDTRKMYIALYDADTEMLTFPFNIRETDEDGILRVEVSSRKVVNLADETQGGLTEFVLRTRKTLRIPNVALWCQEKNFKLPLPPTPKSWMGVPMRHGGHVLGIIALWNDDDENVYEQQDEDVLQAMADQAAVALENARLYDDLDRANKTILESQEKISAAEQLNLISQMGAEFAHKMNNLAGAIPVRVGMAKDYLDSDDPNYKPVMKQLDAIDSHTHQLLEAAKKIKRAGENEPKNIVEINDLLQVALTQVRKVQPEIQGKITISTHFASDLPLLKLERDRLQDVLENVVKNAVDAMPESGTLTITTQKQLKNHKSYIEIVINDTGHGIPTQDLAKVFELFYST